MAVGQQPVPQTAPLFSLVRADPALAIGAASVAFVLTVVAWVIARRPLNDRRRRDEKRRTRRLQVPLVLFASITATASASACALIIILVLVQPPWCPSPLCAEPTGPHDANIEAVFTGFQSPTYVIAGNVQRPPRLPDPRSRTSVAAQRISPGGNNDTSNQSDYRVAVGIHSLVRSRFSLVIDQIMLVVSASRPPPSPLPVVLVGVDTDYRDNPFEVTYRGEPQGVPIAARYSGPVQAGYMTLAPNESDEITVLVASRQIVDLRFQLDIRYRPINETGVRSLRIPYVFEVVFSDQLNWQEYQPGTT